MRDDVSPLAELCCEKRLKSGLCAPTIIFLCTVQDFKCIHKQASEGFEGN